MRDIRFTVWDKKNKMLYKNDKQADMFLSQNGELFLYTRNKMLKLKKKDFSIKILDESYQITVGEMVLKSILKQGLTLI